ncbi:MAG: peptidoglycan recognition protein family protein [Hyphomicrobiales bacterium]
MSRTGLEHRWIPSENFNDRPAGAGLDMLVIHYTGMESFDEAVERMCTPGSQVSCHYGVDLDGSVVQMVAEENRAWHAGASLWRGVSDNNRRSIGIEIQNAGHEFGYHDFPELQMGAVIELCRDILSRHPIPAHNVVAHSDIAPGRKLDPGERFNWQLLFENEIGHWAPSSPIISGNFLQQGDSGKPVEALQTMFQVYGYGLEISGVFDETTANVVTAFQQHWRQERVDGIADISTITTLRELIDTLPESPLTG